MKNSTLTNIIVTVFLTGLIPLTASGQESNKSQTDLTQPERRGSRVYQEGDTMIKEIGEEELEASENYWTLDRLQEAKPLPFRHGKGKAHPPGVLKTEPSDPPIRIPFNRSSQTPTMPPQVPAKQQPVTLEEQGQPRQKELQGRQWTLIRVSGLETKGSKIYVGKIGIKLPQDAYIEHFITHGECIVNFPCPQFPLYIIRRGNSTSEISLGSGSIVGETIAPGEAGAFDFLKKKLPVESVAPFQTVNKVLP